MKKLIQCTTIFSIVVVMITTIIIVHAQETTKQLTNIEKVKQFLNVSNIQIIDEYWEDGIRVFKTHDLDNDKYFKLALDDSNNMSWYDTVKYGEISKIDSNLQTTMETMNSTDKIPVIVELVFDYTSIDSQLKKNNSNYFDNNGIKSTLTDELITEAKQLKKEYTKSVMLSNNRLDEKYEVLAISEYSPFIFLNLTKSEINELLENDKVFSVGMFPEFVQTSVDIDVTNTRAAINNNAITSTRTNIVKNAGLTGSGVKIGQIENSNPNTNNSYLSGKSIIKRTNNCLANTDTIKHATEVAGIMIGDSGVAPDASLYSACYNTSDLIGTFASAMNWLISQNVDIINMSAWVQNTGTYNTMDRWIDAVAYMNDILFVKSSGNSSVAENNVTSPGLAFNAITVGNITYTGTSYVEAMSYSRNTSSNYNIYGNNNQTNKPELVTPGTNVNYTNEYNATVSGTSFSAPLVSGAAALLMENKPSVKNDFRAIKAALFATARPMNNYTKKWYSNQNGWLRTYEHYNNEVGLGILDTKAASDLLAWNQFRNVTVTGGSSDSYVYNNTLGNGLDVRVAITWSKPNTATSYSNVSNSGTDRVADLDLRILGPNGEQIAKSISSYDNVEWVNFVTEQGYGTYQFKIINYATYGNTVPTKVSMAWW